jgi:hypothetical protein
LHLSQIGLIKLGNYFCLKINQIHKLGWADGWTVKHSFKEEKDFLDNQSKN